jgi:hypothetical protein
LRHKVVALAAALAVILSPPLANSARAVAPNDTASSSGSVVVNGKLTDKSSKGTRGKVVALVWPGEDLLKTLEVGDRIETPLVGWTDVGKSGAFELPVDPALIPSTHKRKDGGLNLLLVGSGDSGQGYQFTPAPSPSQAAAMRVGPNASSATTLPKVSLVLDATAATDGSPAIVPNAAPPPMYHCTSWELVSSHLIWETIAQSYSGPAKNYATIESSNTVTSGSAISLGGAAGSWTASGSQTHTSGLTKTFTESLSDRNFQMQVKYGKWHTLCPGNYHRYAFTPTSGTAGDRTLAATQYPAMNYCTTISAGLWSRSSSSGDAYSNSVGVDSSITIDIDLSISHNYSTSSSRKFTLHYRPTRTVRICGDTDYPSLARKPRIPSQ